MQHKQKGIFKNSISLFVSFKKENENIAKNCTFWYRKLFEHNTRQACLVNGGKTPVIVTVELSGDAALSEEQTILGQCPSFVTQQVTHLAELLIQWSVPGLSRPVCLLPIHLYIPANKQAVDCVDHLKPADAHKGSRHHRD